MAAMYGCIFNLLTTFCPVKIVNGDIFLHSAPLLIVIGKHYLSFRLRTTTAKTRTGIVFRK